MTICFDGLDGSGKTTQLELLEEYLLGEGFPVERSRQCVLDTLLKEDTVLVAALEKMSIPSLSDEVVATLYFAQQLAFAEKYLERLDTVWLIDRGVFSMAAYARAMDFKLLPGYNDMIDLQFEILPHPDITFFFDAHPALLQGRLDLLEANRKKARYELLTLEEHKDIRHSFLYYLSKSRGRVVVLDALKSIEEINRVVIKTTQFALDNPLDCPLEKERRKSDGTI